MKQQTSVFIAGALALAAVGCASRDHLITNHGRSVNTALAAQVLNPNAGRDAKPTMALDSQEARIIAKTYRTSLAPKESTNEDRGIVVVPAAANNGGSMQPFLPPASVPESR